MAAATDNLIPKPVGAQGESQSSPVLNAVRIFRGTMVAQVTASGMLKPAGLAAANGPVCGVSEHEANNTSGAAGAIRCKYETNRIYIFANSSAGDQITEANCVLGADIYAADDQTVALTDGGATRVKAGTFAGLEPDGRVRVKISELSRQY